MRYLPLVLLILLACCKPQQPTQTAPCKADTVYLKEPPTIVEVPVQQVVHDTVYLTKTVTDKAAVDSLKTKLFVANYKLERVRYYSKIVQHNPKQGKFLLGWVIRAIR